MKVILPFISSMEFHKVYDGGNKYVHYFSRALAKEGIDVTLVTTLLENKNIKRKIIDNVKYIFLPPKIIGKRLFKLNAPYNFIFSKNLRKYLEKNDFDILHSFGMLAFSYLHKQKAKRKPVITQPWGLEPFYGQESLSQKHIKKIYTKYFIQKPWLYCLKNSDKIASEGEFQLNDLVGLGISKEKVFPLYIGIDSAKIKKFKKGYKNKRKELNIKKEEFVVLSVSQIAPDKGIDDLINAFSLVKKKIKTAKLIVVGAGSLEEMMHDMIKKFNLKKSVIHLKNLPEKELYNLYFSSDVFISAATQKDWIMGIQEAMACGLPVVSSGQPFLVKNKKNGYVVGINNPKGLCEGLTKIYKKGAKKMGRESFNLSKKYEWKNIAKKAIEEYKKLLFFRDNNKMF